MNYFPCFEKRNHAIWLRKYNHPSSSNAKQHPVVFNKPITEKLKASRSPTHPVRSDLKLQW